MIQVQLYLEKARFGMQTGRQIRTANPAGGWGGGGVGGQGAGRSG